MDKVTEMIEWLDEYADNLDWENKDDGLRTACGFEDCIIGVCEKQGQDPCVVYDLEKVITKLMSQGMSREEAYEYYSHNIECAYLGDSMPGYLVKPPQ